MNRKTTTIGRTFRLWKMLAVAALAMTGGFAVRAQQTNRASEAGFSSFQVISERNIFNPNRTARHKRGNRAQPVADAFALVGTMSYAKGTFAFFDGTSPDFRKVLELDGSIADFKVAVITPKSVTLLSGTNESILPLGTQMRRGDDGHWVVSTDTASYAGMSNSFTSGPDRHSQSSSDNSNATVPDGATDAGTNMGAPDTSNLPGGGANDALARLIRQRAQEEQQLGQGSGQ